MSVRRFESSSWALCLSAGVVPWAFYNELNYSLGAQDITYFLSWLVVMACLSMLCDIKLQMSLYLTRVVQGLVCVYASCFAAYIVSLLFHSFTT
jgi:hypothetical protein